MCGIAGIFHVESSKPVDPERLRRVTDAIAHRGPDGAGVWTAPGVGLGHRRLSIIDLGGGAQPMLTEDERYALSFNGEEKSQGPGAQEVSERPRLRPRAATRAGIMVALGLGKINKSRIHESNPQIQGMIDKVAHMLKVEHLG